MGADWVRLFNKQLCDEVRSLSGQEVETFVQPRLSLLPESSIFRCGFEGNVPVSVRISHLQAHGRTEEELKADLVENLCVSAERVLLDYWACYAEVFKSNDPPGSITDYALFPHLREQGYLLLRAEHLDMMLASAEEHKQDARLMSEESFSTLRHWRGQCVRDTNYMVAYFYDY